MQAGNIAVTYISNKGVLFFISIQVYPIKHIFVMARGIPKNHLTPEL